MRSLPFARPDAGILLFACLGLLLGASLSPLAAIAGERTGTPAAPAKSLLSSAADFTATGVDGKTYKLSDLLEKGPVLLDFWTTWCKPCMLEIPHLQKIYEKHGAAGFTLLGIACDDQKSASKIKPTIQSRGFKFPIVTDTDKRIAGLYNNVRNYPTTILIAPDGKIVKIAQGYNPGDEKELEAKILALLPEGGSQGGN